MILENNSSKFRNIRSRYKLREVKSRCTLKHPLCISHFCALLLHSLWTAFWLFASFMSKPADFWTLHTLCTLYCRVTRFLHHLQRKVCQEPLKHSKVGFLVSSNLQWKLRIRIISNKYVWSTQHVDLKNISIQTVDLNWFSATLLWHSVTFTLSQWPSYSTWPRHM